MGLFSSIFGGGSKKVKVDTSSIPALNTNKLIQQEAQTNRINQATPFGNVSFSGPNRSNLRFQLSPQMQALLNRQTNAGIGSVNRGYSMLRQVPGSGNQATNAMLQRLQPGFDRQDQQLRNRLEQSGNPAAYGSQAMAPGAYNELALQQQGMNDARLAAVMLGPQYQQTLAQTASGLINGSPIGVPQYNFQGATPINVGGLGLGAYQSQLGAASGSGIVNAQNAQSGSNNLFGGLFDLGAAGIGAAGQAGSFASLFSDRRLKRDIEQIGTLASGLPLYAYHYVWDRVRHVGVMADEVAEIFPDAVMTHSSGFAMVDYARIG